MIDQFNNPQVQQQKADIVKNATLLLHSPESRDKVIAELKNNRNPIQALGAMASFIMIELDKQSAKQGVQISDEAKIIALIDVISLILELGVAASALPDLDEDSVMAAASYAIQEYVKYLISTGKVNPQELYQSVQQALQQLEPEKQQEVDASMKRMGNAAAKYEQPVNQQSVLQQPVPNQQQGGM